MPEHHIRVMPRSFDERAASLAVQRQCDDPAATVDRLVWYPYFYYEARCAVPTLFGRRPAGIPCLVDAVNGVASTCDPFEPQEYRAHSDTLLNPETAGDDAARAARSVVSHRLGKRARMIADFRIQLDAPRLVYRGFWIVGSGDRAIMVDSVTGTLQFLRGIAA